jgi:hypothetical protein
VKQEIGFAVSANKTILLVEMEAELPVPAFISELKYLSPYENWEGSGKRPPPRTGLRQPGCIQSADF